MSVYGCAVLCCAVSGLRVCVCISVGRKIHKVAVGWKKKNVCGYKAKASPHKDVEEKIARKKKNMTRDLLRTKCTYIAKIKTLYIVDVLHSSQACDWHSGTQINEALGSGLVGARSFARAGECLAPLQESVGHNPEPTKIVRTLCSTSLRTPPKSPAQKRNG